MKLEQKRGFTLIELLVVIAIIGLLASIVLASLNTARKKSRDARRLADLKQLQNALELYANDNSGNYPSNAVTVLAAGGSAQDGTANGLKTLLTTGTTVYIAAIPADPLGGTVVYVYKTIPAANNAANATGYCIGAKIEGTVPTPASTCQASATTFTTGDTDTGITGAQAPNYEVGN